MFLLIDVSIVIFLCVTIYAYANITKLFEVLKMRRRYLNLRKLSRRKNENLLLILYLIVINTYSIN